MDDLLISLFLFAIGMFLILVFAKRTSGHPLGWVEKIQAYGTGAFFLGGSVFVLLRYVYQLWQKTA